MNGLQHISAALPVDYRPEDGLKNMAVAQAAEIYFGRAKDSTKLYEAIAAKLGEQRRFVLWWDGQEKSKGGRPPENPSQTGEEIPTLDTLGLDYSTVHRWRTKLKDEKKFDAELERASDRCVRICEAAKGQTAQRGASGTGENEWYTPEEYLAAARDVLGDIDLDPASSDFAQNHVGAGDYFTQADDGLSKPWFGRVWLNPPYAQPFITEFVSKMCLEVRAGNVAAGIMLTHNYTDTAWFHEAAGACSAICFTRGRVKFYGPSGETAAPTQGQAFFYFGEDIASFARRFGSIGFIVEPMGADS